MEVFNPEELKKLYVPPKTSNGEDNGQVTIIGGSSLFHGAPIVALTAASRIVDMLFFASPEPTLEKVVAEMKSKLSSYIWVPWEELDHYIQKSDAILIGPGFLRYHSENVPHEERYTVCDQACQVTTKVTKELLEKYPDKRWVIDAGSLQVMDTSWIPPRAILTPNKKEFETLFKVESTQENVIQKAKEFNCIIVDKGRETTVASKDKCVKVLGGNAGLTKGATGDTQAGLTVALLAKNDPFLSAASASYLIKKTADVLFEKQKTYYNADDLASEIPQVMAKLI